MGEEKRLDHPGMDAAAPGSHLNSTVKGRTFVWSTLEKTISNLDFIQRHIKSRSIHWFVVGAYKTHIFF